MTEDDIRKAYVRIREIDHTIPDDVLDFMKNTAIDALRKERTEKELNELVRWRKKNRKLIMQQAKEMILEAERRINEDKKINS